MSLITFCVSVCFCGFVKCLEYFVTSKIVFWWWSSKLPCIQRVRIVPFIVVVLVWVTHRRGGAEAAAARWRPGDRAGESGEREDAAAPAGAPKVPCISRAPLQGPGSTSGFEDRNTARGTSFAARNNFQPPLTIPVRPPFASSTLSFFPRRKRMMLVYTNKIEIIPRLVFYLLVVKD